MRELVYGAIRSCGEVPASGRAALLRLAEGAEVTVFDNQGHAWRALVTGKLGNLARVELQERLPGRPAPHSQLLIAAALIKRRAMDWMIEKLSELDVVSLQPL
ncbi:MAG: 16S rRNA (uracil(1498)-N(3))-methyltransferase, partial [SAR324 cluster bacterium]|nr:16S rRNA (uracil(1498)-N(3))-methyltransferase [SAR324 cluster bacterium]